MKTTFADLGVSPKLLTILDRLNFTVPTHIQAQAIPVALRGEDVIGIAQTGTGKTLAFSLPLLQQISRAKKQGLIILPTRELAHQVATELNKVGGQFGLRTVLLIGGAPMRPQVSALKRKPHVVIGTPGRINDHLKQGNLKLSDVGILVLDEADRMLDMGFEPQIKQIIKHVPVKRQTMLFSATMPQQILRLVQQYMKKPVRVEVAPAGTVAERIDHELFFVEKHQKNQLLDKLLADYPGAVLVFSRTKYGARKICRLVRDMGHGAAELHSNLTLSQRRRSLEGFKSGTHRVLIATDIAARGIDVANIALVINYDLPDNPDDYIHRVGRTGRAGKKGKAVSFATGDQRRDVKDIERSVRQRIKVSTLPALPPARASRGGSGHASLGGTGHTPHVRHDRKQHAPDKHQRGSVKPQRQRSGHSPRPHQKSGTRQRNIRVHS